MRYCYFFGEIHCVHALVLVLFCVILAHLAACIIVFCLAALVICMRATTSSTMLTLLA